ncbi:MAG TPA: type II toxin-antitoxin system ParD family antitoxin [Planctomycetota bacterium]|nr:type II toxin-antitoxin system ParD family antitoxin [Planctomycetota bacterium]
MAKNTSMVLGPHFERFVAELVRSGRYASASEVLRAGLRLLEEDQQRLEALRAALVAGELSGADEPLDVEQILITARRRAAGSA